MPARCGPKDIQGARLSVVSALVALAVCIVVTPTLSAGSTGEYALSSSEPNGLCLLSCLSSLLWLASNS
jgi:hypothetical protein